MVSTITEQYRQIIRESELLSQEGKTSAITKVGRAREPEIISCHWKGSLKTNCESSGRLRTVALKNRIYFVLTIKT